MKNKKSGFTLIELVMAITIMTLAMTASIRVITFSMKNSLASREKNEVSQCARAALEFYITIDPLIVKDTFGATEFSSAQRETFFNDIPSIDSFRYRNPGSGWCFSSSCSGHTDQKFVNFLNYSNLNQCMSLSQNPTTSLRYWVDFDRLEHNYQQGNETKNIYLDRITIFATWRSKFFTGTNNYNEVVYFSTLTVPEKPTL